MDSRVKGYLRPDMTHLEIDLEAKYTMNDDETRTFLFYGDVLVLFRWLGLTNRTNNFMLFKPNMQ